MTSGNRKKASDQFNSGGRAVTTNYTIPNIKKFEALIGKDDKNVLLLSEKLGVKISHRATTLIISGKKETAHRARELLERLVDTLHPVPAPLHMKAS